IAYSDPEPLSEFAKTDRYIKQMHHRISFDMTKNPELCKRSIIHGMKLSDVANPDAEIVDLAVRTNINNAMDVMDSSLITDELRQFVSQSSHILKKKPMFKIAHDFGPPVHSSLSAKEQV